MSDTTMKPAAEDEHLYRKIGGMWIQKQFTTFTGEVVEKAPMNAATRNALPDSDFAYITTDANGNKVRKLPINDAAHVRAALARFNQTQGIPAGDKAKVLAKIQARAKKLGIDVAGN